MDSFFTSLNKRQTMLLLTATTFGGQEGVAALDFLPEEQAELLKHRAQEILQIPREQRVPALVQEIKRLVKDRRGMLWSADPARLAALLSRERGALVEVVLRALPAALAEAVRAHLPPTGVKLMREVRPQVLDIVRWKLEAMLAREGAVAAGFRFSDVMMMPTRELLTVCDRLGARVLGPAMAGLPSEELEPLIKSLPPDLKLLATKAVAANAPRKLAEEDARAQLEVHEGLQDLGSALRSAGVQRLARACLAQSPEFAARMLERHRGDFGQLLGRWVREERAKPPPKGDGGRTDIVADLERLAARGYIERPIRMPQMPAKPAAPAKPGAPVQAAAPRSATGSGAPAAAPRVPVPPQVGRAGASLPPLRRPVLGGAARREGAAPGQAESAPRRDPMAERAARRAGALSSREPARAAPPTLGEGASDGSRVHRLPPRPEASGNGASPGRDGRVGRRESLVAGVPVLREARPGPDARGSRVGSAPTREGSKMGPAPDGSRMGPVPTRSGARAAPVAAPDGSKMGPAPSRDGSRMGPAPTRGGARATPVPASDGSKVGTSPARDGSKLGSAPARDGSKMGPAPARGGSRMGSAPAREGSRSGPAPASEGPRVRPRVEPGEASVSTSRPAPPKLTGASVRVSPLIPLPRAPGGGPPPSGEVSRVLSSAASRNSGRVARRPAPASEPERPPRVVAGRASTASAMPAVNAEGEGTVVRRHPKPAAAAPVARGRGPRGGTR